MFTKWWNSIKTFLYFFLTYWRHMRCKNTIEISTTYWNMDGFTISFSFRQLHIFLLEEALISCQTNLCSGSTKQKRSNGWVGPVRINKKMSAVFPFISTLYLKQHPVGTRYCGVIGFLLDLHCDIDRLRLRLTWHHYMISFSNIIMML